MARPSAPGTSKNDPHLVAVLPNSFCNKSRHLIICTAIARPNGLGVLRYPVFVKDDDCRGSPDMTNHPLLRKYLLENFAAEIEELKDAVFVGLGPQTQKVLARLI